MCYSDVRSSFIGLNYSRKLKFNIKKLHMLDDHYLLFLLLLLLLVLLLLLCRRRRRRCSCCCCYCF
jgi:hypothetical protein